MKLMGQHLAGRDGHSAGLALLEQLYGGPLPEICRTERGKPYFADRSAHFSISHTKNHVFCVLSDRSVGIDGQEADRDIDLRLAEKILSPGEKRQYDAAADKRLALLTFWVLKEAAGKRDGTGLKIWPNHTDFSLPDPRVQEIDGCLVAVVENDKPPFLGSPSGVSRD